MTFLALDPGIEEGLQLAPAPIEAMVGAYEVARHLVNKHLGDVLRDLVPLGAQLLPKHVGGDAELQTWMGLGKGDGLVLEVVLDVIQGNTLIICVCGRLRDVASLLRGCTQYFWCVQYFVRFGGINRLRCWSRYKSLILCCRVTAD